MKTKFAFLLIAVVVLAGLLTACPTEDVKEEVTITFISNGGNLIDPITLERGKSLNDEYPVPVRNWNFEFFGWYDGFTEYTRDTEIYADITLTAKWIEDTVTVTFNDADETLYTIAVVKGGVLGLRFPAAPRKQGYALDGWFADNDEYTKDTPVTSDITLTAKWRQLTEYYTVTFDATGGEFVAPFTGSIQVLAGECIDEWGVRFPVDGADVTYTDPENPEAQYFIFQWVDEVENIIYDGRTPVMGNVTVTAVWREILKAEFDVDLSQYRLDNYNLATWSAAAQEGVKYENGVLSIAFTGENQPICIGVLDDELMDLLMVANSVTIDIDGDVNDNTRLFRVLIGNPVVHGVSWNATQTHEPGNVPFADLSRELDIKEDTRNEETVKYLVIQARGGGHTAASPTVVTIRSIKIAVK